MKFYRNHYGSAQDSGESTGFEFFTSRAAALSHAKDKTPHIDDRSNIAELIVVTPTKSGILAALNTYADHPDNG